jgi:hypothetical protein
VIPHGSLNNIALIPTIKEDVITAQRRDVGMGHCDILTQCLIRLIEYAYHQGIPSFPKAHLQRTPELSMLGLEQFQDG